MERRFTSLPETAPLQQRKAFCLLPLAPHTSGALFQTKTGYHGCYRRSEVCVERRGSFFSGDEGCRPLKVIKLRFDSRWASHEARFKVLITE
ncbi:hypothetical protein E3N88_41390 [Mikania micrantha]|uniref:Uncharacterized protein n=1 Tax=Mikania micrantha TaxID=192012 RepID=A0A5N6LQ94_9ASTR|nr:hypothetical protein E3N88_41390 [Mikania micrantha]